MAARRGVPLPLLIVFLAGVGAAVFLNREPPPERAPGALATTTLDAPIIEFRGLWSVAERVLAQKEDMFTLRTLVAEVPLDRGAPPSSWYLAFRSVSNEEDFSLRVDNAELRMVIAATFPTPPRFRNSTTPESIDAQAVTVTLRQALAVADSVLATRFHGESGADVLADVVLRARAGTPEWIVSYSRDGEAGPERVATVVLRATDGVIVEGAGG